MQWTNQLLVLTVPGNDRNNLKPNLSNIQFGENLIPERKVTPRDACHVIGTTYNDRWSLRNTFGWMGSLGRI